MSKKTLMRALLAAATVPLLMACSQGAHGPHVAFIEPQDGATVGQDVKVVMDVHGMQVHKAGELIDGTGHHHLIIDGSFVPKGEVVGKDATHKHFGKGQTETTLHLKPGEHTLTLQFADGHHQSYGRDMSETIHLHVK
ncbi:MAG: DUF4399 domain-containing protein [Mariprofundaceae bacterium]